MTDPVANVNSIKIGTREVGVGLPVFIIAEIGVNHEGDVNICAQMIKSAVQAGADSVKLQTADPNENYAPGTSSYEIYNSCKLSPGETEQMFQLARSLGAEPFTTTDASGLNWLESLNPPAFKVSSGLMGHIPLIQRLAATGKPLVMSTGISTMPEIREAINAARRSSNGGVALLQCTSLYPAPRNTLNLASIRRLASEFQCPVGFSDHSTGITAAPLAVAAGAQIIEKHFTFNKKRPGFDHQISLEAHELEQMIRTIRDAETVMGNDHKNLSPEQEEIAVAMRRCIVAALDIQADQQIKEEDLGVMRVSDSYNGLHPRHYFGIIGVVAPRALKAFEPIPKDFMNRFDLG